MTVDTSKLSFSPFALMFSLGLFFLLLIAYWPSFSVPFYLDDRTSISDNLLLSHGSMLELFHVYGLRFITYLSFWLNHQWFEGTLLSYHVVNFAIHLVNGFLVYRLTSLLSEQFSTGLSVRQKTLLPLIVTAFWLLHPLNIQAVTYVVQRTAALVTLFVVLATLSYLKLRLNKFSFLQCSLLVLSIICGVLTKQNFFVVVIFIVLFEYYFMASAKRLIQYSILFALMVIALAYPFYQELFQALSSLTKETTAISRSDYFITQLLVLWQYIYKVFVPINLQLDMGVELVKESTGWHFLAFLAHGILISFAIIQRKKIPLFTLGILWFYAGHSIESFVIPITDLAFEHRTYLPNIGFILAFVALLSALKLNDKVMISIALVIVIFLAIATYQRNVLWQTPFDFYKNELSHSPNSPRSNAAFAEQLIKKGELAEAEKLFLISVQANLKKGQVTVSALNNLMKVRFQQGKYQAGVQTAMLALKYIHQPKDKSYTLTTIAYGYIQMGWCDFALGLAKSAVKLDNSNEQAKSYVIHCNKVE